MELKVAAVAGTTDKNDIFISIEPSSQGIEISLKSKVMEQFGDNIRETIENTLKDMGISSAKIEAEDNGAVEVVIMSRVQTAGMRSAQSTKYIWK